MTINAEAINSLFAIGAAILGYCFARKQAKNQIPKAVLDVYKILGKDEILDAYETGKAAGKDLSGAARELAMRKAAADYLRRVAQDRGIFVPDSILNLLVEYAVSLVKAAAAKVQK